MSLCICVGLRCYVYVIVYVAMHMIVLCWFVNVCDGDMGGVILYVLLMYVQLLKLFVCDVCVCLYLWASLLELRCCVLVCDSFCVCKCVCWLCICVRMFV